MYDIADVSQGVASSVYQHLMGISFRRCKVCCCVCRTGAVVMPLATPTSSTPLMRKQAEAQGSLACVFC